MIYTLFNLLLFPITISYFYLFFLKKDNKLLRLAVSIFFVDMITNFYFYFDKSNSLITLSVDSMRFSFYIKYFFLIVVFNMITNLFIDFLRKKEKIKIYYFSTLFTSMIATSASIYFIWLLSTSGRMKFTTFMYNLTTPVNTNISGFYDQLYNIIFFCFLMLVCLIYIFTKGNLFERIKHSQRRSVPMINRIGVGCIPVFLLIFVGYLPYYSFHLENAYDVLFATSTEDFPREHYVDPNDVTLTWPDEKRNLVYIFMESLESSYFSKELGGLSNNNLLPNLSNLMNEGVFFSNHPNSFGGYESLAYTNWTIGGMVTATSGMLHKLAGEYRDDPAYCLVPGVTTIMDLLTEQGYNTKFFTGTSSTEYNIGPYYSAHQVPVEDYNTLKEKGKIPNDYKEWFGIEDSKLYEFAKEDITDLSKKEEPFLYILNTNDTHAPEGYIDKSCKNEFALEAENSIACADQMVSEFVGWLKTQPYYDNTTVVILGDHISHENLLTKSFSVNEKENRRVFNLILNANSPETGGSQYNRAIWSADLFPTVLSAMNVKIDGNKLGLGSNLFSDVPSLLEIYGGEAVESSLSKNSDFYYEKYKVDPNKLK